MSAEEGSSEGGEKLRVLCLHSFRTSANILRDQLDIAQWGSSLGDLCEFTFMDAPHLATGEIPADVASFFEPPYREWWNANEVDGRIEYVGLDESLAAIDDFAAQHGPFDGVLGFSQGATLTGLLAATGIAEGKGPFACGIGVGEEAAPTTPPPFALMISGMLARTASARELYAAAAAGVEAAAERGGAEAATPSLHIVGDSDKVLPPALSKRAAAAAFFVDAKTVRHERGHVIPLLRGKALEDVRAFLKQRLQQRRPGARTIPAAL